jgi:hypothetical protein
MSGYPVPSTPPGPPAAGAPAEESRSKRAALLGYIGAGLGVLMFIWGFLAWYGSASADLKGYALGSPAPVVIGFSLFGSAVVAARLLDRTTASWFIPIAAAVVALLLSFGLILGKGTGIDVGIGLTLGIVTALLQCAAFVLAWLQETGRIGVRTRSAPPWAAAPPYGYPTGPDAGYGQQGSGYGAPPPSPGPPGYPAPGYVAPSWAQPPGAAAATTGQYSYPPPGGVAPTSYPPTAGAAATSSYPPPATYPPAPGSAATSGSAAAPAEAGAPGSHPAGSSTGAEPPAPSTSPYAGYRPAEPGSGYPSPRPSSGYSPAQPSSGYSPGSGYQPPPAPTYRPAHAPDRPAGTSPADESSPPAAPGTSAPEPPAPPADSPASTLFGRRHGTESRPPDRPLDELLGGEPPRRDASE